MGNTTAGGGPERFRRPLLRTMLGAVLRRLRRRQGRTLADVAWAAGVSMPYLSEVERGRKEASSEVLEAICDALGIDLAQLLAEVGRDLVAAGRPESPRVLGVAVVSDGAGADPRRRGVSPEHGTGDVHCALAA